MATKLFIYMEFLRFFQCIQYVLILFSRLKFWYFSEIYLDIHLLPACLPKLVFSIELQLD
jgi:hypothetical protein